MARTVADAALMLSVMAGNDAARAFYERVGYRLGEHVLYRRDAGRVPSGP